MRFIPFFVLLLVLVGCGRPEVIVDDGETIECPPGEVGPRGPAGPPGPSVAVETYVVDVDQETEPGAATVTALASCDEGDQLLAGGCSWGEVVDAHDPPLRPLVDGPTSEGWTCEGQNSGVGVELKVVTASAVCLAL